MDFDEIDDAPRLGGPVARRPAVAVRTPAPLERLIDPTGAVAGDPALRLREVMAREGITDLEPLSLMACAVIYGEIHGVPITPEALGYRLRTRNMSKFDILCAPKSQRGKRPQTTEVDRRSGRSGRQRTRSAFAPPCPVGYLYSHLDYTAGRGVEVRFVGYGRGSAFCDTSGQLCDYAADHLEWLQRWAEHSGRLIGELKMECLGDPDWLLTSGRTPSGTTTTTSVILTSKMINMPESAARLLYIRMHKAGHQLFKEASYWPPGT